MSILHSSPVTVLLLEGDSRRRKVVMTGGLIAQLGGGVLIFQVNTWVMTDGSVERNFLDDELLQLITIPCNLIQ